MTSLSLLTTSELLAFVTKDAFLVAMTSIGAISLAENGLKWYQLNMGKPIELKIKSD